jgi:hypothetical protein
MSDERIVSPRLIPTPTFEYLVDSPKGGETTQEWLNRHGSDAWELVQFHVNAQAMGGALTGFFKRVTGRKGFLR